MHKEEKSTLEENFKAYPLMQGDVMNHAPRRNPAYRRRRIHSKGFPYVRFATVRAKNKRSPFSPSLVLRGDWLTEAGFLPHLRVRISVHAQRLEIELLPGAGVGDPWPPPKPLTCPVNVSPQHTKYFGADRPRMLALEISDHY